MVSGEINSFGHNIMYAGITHKGRVKQKNEDSFLILPKENIYCIADGAGGLNAGEIASELTVDIIEELVCVPDSETGSSRSLFFNILELIKKIFDIRKNDNNLPVSLQEIIEIANYCVLHRAKITKKMASTIVIVHLCGDYALLANVGDSRAYLWRNHKLVQITNDHSVVGDLYRRGVITREEMRTHPRRHVITRAIGNNYHVKPEFYKVKIRSDDIILLCSDGLSSMIDDNYLNKIICNCKDNMLKTCSELVDAANESGGKDNVTVVAVRINGSKI